MFLTETIHPIYFKSEVWFICTLTNQQQGDVAVIATERDIAHVVRILERFHQSQKAADFSSSSQIPVLLTRSETRIASWQQSDLPGWSGYGERGGAGARETTDINLTRCTQYLVSVPDPTNPSRVI